MTWVAFAPGRKTGAMATAPAAPTAPTVVPPVSASPPAATSASAAPASGPAARRLDPDSETALVVSEPMLNKAGRLRFLLCNDAGRFAVSARKDDPVARAAGFFGLKRGDRIRLRGAELRGTSEAEALGFLPATGLEILVPAPSIAAAAAPSLAAALQPAGAAREKRHG